jgi:hypothetical protein
MPAAAVVFTVVAIFTLLSERVRAQEPPPRIGPFVIDVRGTSPSFPQDALLAQSRGLSVGELPRRGFGLDGGAHLYLFKWRVITVGIGVQATLARATSSSVVQDGVETARAVTSWFTSFTPQLSFNFGTGDGWSYISGGIGKAVWSTVPNAQSPLPGDEERLNTVNYGGGARWFAKTHLAFTFDVRFHQIDPGTPMPGLPGSPRTTMMIIGAGVSLK